MHEPLMLGFLKTAKFARTYIHKCRTSETSLNAEAADFFKDTKFNRLYLGNTNE